MPEQSEMVMRVTRIVTPFVDIDWSTDVRVRALVQALPFSIDANDHRYDQQAARRHTRGQPLRIIIFAEFNGGRETQQTWYYAGTYSPDSDVTTFIMALADPKIGHPECFQTLYDTRDIHFKIDIEPQELASGSGGGNTEEAEEAEDVEDSDEDTDDTA